MYKDKMVAAIKNNGKVLREFKDQVYIPFGSEYQISLKNLNTRKVCVHIEIDGTKVTGDGLVIHAGQSFDLERFIDSGNLDQGNKFKFIERNAKVEATRGIGVEDGLIRIEFEYEKQVTQFNWDVAKFSGVLHSAASADAIASTWITNTSYGSGDVISKGGNMTLSASASSLGFAETIQNDQGITVKGSVSDQKFYTTTFTGDGVKEVMVLKLLGETNNGKIEKPVTVKTKSKCITCNHQNKATAKFCSECGAGLTIV